MTQNSRNSTITLAATSSKIAEEIFRPSDRKQIIITNTDAAATITISKGSKDAVLNQGIILSPNATYLESSDTGFQCWQGEFTAISTGNTTISIVEVIENGK